MTAHQDQVCKNFQPSNPEAEAEVDVRAALHAAPQSQGVQSFVNFQWSLAEGLGALNALIVGTGSLLN